MSITRTPLPVRSKAATWSRVGGDAPARRAQLAQVVRLLEFALAAIA
jgi:hypothetical protein